jgi:hypothetical protein
MLAIVKNCGMSDDQRDNEYGCQKRLQAAIIEMTQALEMVNTDSAVQKVSIAEWDCFIHDSLPDFFAWSEKIERARS